MCVYRVKWVPSSSVWTKSVPWIKKAFLKAPELAESLVFHSFMHHYCPANINKLMFWTVDAECFQSLVWANRELDNKPPVSTSHCCALSLSHKFIIQSNIPWKHGFSSRSTLRNYAGSLLHWAITGTYFCPPTVKLNSELKMFFPPPTFHQQNFTNPELC